MEAANGNRAGDAPASTSAGGALQREHGVPELSVVAPAYNERANIRPLVAAIDAALPGIVWELIVVDDDSPDGTGQEVAALAGEGWPVRAIRRVGRRGLSSAVMEGAMSASGALVAVIDADLQHDERLLPRMAALLRDGAADIVIGSRYVAGGGMGEWDETRQRMSRVATRAARLLIGDTVSDPMSGFFMTRRDVLDAAIHGMAQQGYKVLLDLLTSSPRPLRIAELPYTFRTRQAGESKVDAMIVVEFAFLLIDKLTRGLVPPRFVLFAFVGGLGLAVHMAVLRVAIDLDVRFLAAQGAATLAAMTFNFWLNNAVTYRSDRLRGGRMVRGYAVFCVVCSLGVIANVSVADLTMAGLGNWALAGIAGAIMSAVFNFGLATRFVWGHRRRRSRIVRARAGNGVRRHGF